MTTLAQIRAAYRTGITANTAQADLLRQLRRPWRDGDDTLTDLTEAMRWFLQTATAAIDENRWQQALAVIVANLALLPDTGARSLLDVRNRFRSLLVDAAAPAWLKDACQKLKRTLPVRIAGDGTRTFDQQNTDPIEALADAATATIAAANSTAEQIIAAELVLSQWRELTPTIGA